MRLAIENGALQPATRHLGGFEHGIFQVGLRATIAATDHRPLRLARVKPSYRFRDWLAYPAMGLNCGVENVSPGASSVVLGTTRSEERRVGRGCVSPLMSRWSPYT